MKKSATLPMANATHPAQQNPNLPCRRVLVISPQPFYEDRGTPIALCYLVRALSELGYHVDFLTFPVGQPVIFPRLRLIRVANPLRIKSVPVGLSLRKLFFDALLLLKTRKQVRISQYCAVHAVEEASFIAALFCHGIPIIYDMASSLPEQLSQKRIFRLSKTERILRALEQWVVSRVSYVICSAGLIDHVRELNPHVPAKEWWFPGTTESITEKEIHQLRQSLGIAPGDTMLLYAGTFEKYQGIELLLEAIRIVLRRNQKAHFVLIGATDTDLRAFSRSLILDPHEEGKVKLLKRQPRKYVSKYLAAAEYLISPRVHGRNVPLKVFDYLAAGKPILASDTAAHRAILDESRAAFFQNSPHHLAGIIQELFDDPARATMLATRAQEYANQHLSWDNFRKTIAEIYSRWCDCNQG